MQTASFVGIIRTLFYIMAFYYVIKFLARLFMPLIMRKVVEKAGQSFKNQQQYTQDNSWSKAQSQDEILYQTPKSDKPRETKKVGDYVDYEEID
ncbi:MAG: hypothetical protein QG594_364 [Bacteroidota bacterium]|nr:hypothetical protein [Bacteroidota bacterium]